MIALCGGVDDCTDYVKAICTQLQPNVSYHVNNGFFCRNVCVTTPGEGLRKLQKRLEEVDPWPRPTNLPPHVGRFVGVFARTATLPIK